MIQLINHQESYALCYRPLLGDTQLLIQLKFHLTNSIQTPRCVKSWDMLRWSGHSSFKARRGQKAICRMLKQVYVGYPIASKKWICLVSTRKYIDDTC